MRIVSLLPSATEIVYALGLGDRLVGVTFECDHPRRARHEATVVVGGLDTSNLSPGEIDAAVQARVAAGEDLYTLHADALRDLDPTLVLTQDLCRVCALPSGSVTDALDHLGCRAQVLSLDPHSLSDVLDTILEVGRATGRDSQAETLLTGLRSRLEAVAGAVAGAARPRTAVVEWVDPPYTAGHWVPDLVTAAGGTPVGGAVSGGRSVQATWSDLAAGDPEVVVVAPCGFGLADAVAQAAAVVGHFPGAEVWAVDSGSYVVRPGPRLVDGVEALAWVLHPDRVSAPPPGRVVQVAPALKPPAAGPMGRGSS